MGKIFYLMGKSASGKDTLFQRLKEKYPEMKSVIMYTTRPIRSNEANGREYFFVNRDMFLAMKESGKMIECRTYQTIHGPWDYFTMDDGQVDLERYNYLLVGTLESYEKLREYYGEEAMCPLYIELDDGIRLERALARERQQAEPKYRELCRRYLADDVDFSEENLEKAGITTRYCNEDLTSCLRQLSEAMSKSMNG